MARAKKKKGGVQNDSRVHSSASSGKKDDAEATESSGQFRVAKIKLYRSHRKSTEPRPVRKPVPAAPQLFMHSLAILKNNWKLFAGVLGIYAVVDLLFVGGVSSGSLSAAKALLDRSGNSNGLSRGFTLFGSLVSSNSGSSPSASAYETILFLLMSVILIWALRQVYANNQIRIRDAFYNGTYPLIPFILVLLVIGLQLVPLLIGGALYGLLMNGIAVGVQQQSIAVLIFFGSAILSFYLITSSVFALYIVTLPDMAPMRALKSARELVRYRRWVVLRKILFLPLALLVLGMIIVMPIALYLTVIATFIFFCLTILALAVVHSYMYALYRELL